jgi:diguanylate cyclase (GGDEF)-like protein
VQASDKAGASISPADLAACLAALLPAILGRHGHMLALKRADGGRYLHADAAMAAFLGRDAADIVGACDADLLEPALAMMMRAADASALANGGVLVSEHRFDWLGQRRDFSVLRLVHDGPLGRIVCSVWTDQAPARQKEAQLRNALEQIEQLQLASAKLRQELAGQGLRDAASGLATRAHFEDQLRREVDLSMREQREFALVFIEVDPPAGADDLEVRARVFDAVGRLLRGNTRAMDASCRLADSRFAVLLSGVGLATAHSRMEGLRRQCATQIVVIDGRDMGFTVSMGVATFPHTAQTQADLLSACEGALAEARRRGGNHVALASIRLGESG